MTEQTNIYKDLYDLQQAYAVSQNSLQSIYQILTPLVAPHGVQLTLQEVIDLVAQKLSTEAPEPVLTQDQQVASEAHDVTPDKG